MRPEAIPLPSSEAITTRTEPALLRAKAAAALCSVGLATWWRWDAAGRMPRGAKIGGARLWSRAELLAWIDAGCPGRAEWQARQAAQHNGRP